MIWMNLEGADVRNKPVANLVRIAVILLCILLSWRVGQVWAQNIDKSRWYESCLKLAVIDAEQAFEEGLAWQDNGGGDGALHCIAVALIGMEHFEEGATRLEALATVMAPGTSSELRAEVLAQAGQAWLRAENLERAFAVQTSALKLAQLGSMSYAEILIDRAITLAEASNYWEAIDDLNLATEIAQKLKEGGPEQTFGLVLRASAYRFVDELPLALEDAEAALALSPDYPEALLERGIIRRLMGDDNGARADWLTLTRLYSSTRAAQAARRNIERLDVKIP
jgi:tetratricopeptide (TPR) repeat protein